MVPSFCSNRHYQHGQAVDVRRPQKIRLYKNLVIVYIDFTNFLLLLQLRSTSISEVIRMKRIFLLLCAWLFGFLVLFWYRKEVTMTNISQIFEQAVSFIQQKDPKFLNLLRQKTTIGIFRFRRFQSNPYSPHSFIC